MLVPQLDHLSISTSIDLFRYKKITIATLYGKNYNTAGRGHIHKQLVIIYLFIIIVSSYQYQYQFQSQQEEDQLGGKKAF